MKLIEWFVTRWQRSCLHSADRRYRQRIGPMHVFEWCLRCGAHSFEIAELILPVVENPSKATGILHQPRRFASRMMSPTADGSLQWTRDVVPLERESQ